MLNLSRILFAMGIIAFATIITAGSCDKNKKGGSSLQLEVKSLDETTAKVEEKDGTATIKILETKVFGKAKAATHDYAGYAAKDVFKDVFTVTLKDSKAGFVFSNAYAKASSIDKMTANIALSIEDGNDSFVSTITEAGESKSKFGLVSTWISRGFTSKKKTAKIGLVCVAAFSIAADRVDEIVGIAAKALAEDADAKKKLSDAKDGLGGTQKSTCSIGGTSISGSDYEGWVKDTEATSKIELLFAGIEFSDGKLGDLYTTAPKLLSKGLDTTTAKSIVGKFTHVTKRVNITLVESLE